MWATQHPHHSTTVPHKHRMPRAHTGTGPPGSHGASSSTEQRSALWDALRTGTAQPTTDHRPPAQRGAGRGREEMALPMSATPRAPPQRRLDALGLVGGSGRFPRPHQEWGALWRPPCPLAGRLTRGRGLGLDLGLLWGEGRSLADSPRRGNGRGQRGSRHWAWRGAAGPRPSGVWAAWLQNGGGEEGREGRDAHSGGPGRFPPTRM
jgi:hypothetical protein